MPTISLELFDDPPSIGDDVVVTGKVESINEETNEVEVTYDSVKNKDEKSNKKKESRKRKEENNEIDSTDEALAREFPDRMSMDSGMMY